MPESLIPKSFFQLLGIIDNLPDDFDFKSLYRLLLPNDARPHGFVRQSIVETMPWSKHFKIDASSRTIQLIHGDETLDVGESCTKSFQDTIDAAINNKTYSILNSHSESYKIIGAKYFVSLERFAAPLFGTAGRGAHMTAFVRTPEGIKLWVARRAKHLVTYPGRLDTTVAGGVKADQSPFECIVAEAHEEASLPESLVRPGALAVGVITHCLLSKRTGGLSTAVLYLYDLELPEGCVPEPMDDEVESFELMGVKKVRETMLKQEFKPNSSLVMMDFLIRHGIFTEEDEPSYAEIAARLRRKLPMAITPEAS